MVFKKGNIPHNKGKTKYNYKPLKIVSEKVTLTNKNNPNLINAVRKSMTLERNKKVSDAKIKYWKNLENRLKQSKIRKKYLEKNNIMKGEKNPNYKHGLFINSDEGRKIFKKFNKKIKCEICKKDTSNILGYCIIIHHKDRNKKNNNLNNLQPLCQSCHARLHGVERW
jgi:5-methylcytosine-specific restriction endonuclease McrA